MKIFSYLKYLFHRLITFKEVLEVGSTEEGLLYRVVRIKYLFQIYPTELNIEGKNGVYSSIWEKNKKNGPYYPCIQKHILTTQLDTREKKHVLVLGGAGCAIPRFYLANYTNSEVIVVECSMSLVNVARRYFFDGIDTNRMRLICDDAFQYVKDSNMIFQVIFVDLFNQDKLVSGVFQRDFYDDIWNILSDDGIIYMNLYGIGDAQYQYLESILISGFDLHHLVQENVNFLYLRKK